VTRAASETGALARALMLATVAALSLALVACAAAPAAPTSPATSSPVPVAVPPDPDEGILNFSAYGDSLTAGDADRILLVDEMDESYWQLATALAGIEYAGGWARGGATSADIAAAATPAADADWAVVLMGTNDIFARQDSVWDSWASVLETSGSRRMLVLAIPPIKHQEEEAAEVNAWLEQQADEHGVAFFDPWTSLRAPDGISWREGTSFDGIHPAVDETPAVGRAIADELRRLDARD
jgi:lysophospholipase L1-like esterase